MLCVCGQIYIYTGTVAKHYVCIHTRRVLMDDRDITGTCCTQVSET